MTIFFGERNAALFKLTKFVAKPLLYPFFRIETIGLENLPERGSFILLPKHQRWEDIPLLGLVIPRPLYYIAKYELFLNPILRWFLSSLGGIPLNRARPLKSRRSFKMIVESLQAEEGIVIFPEGTYYRDSMGSGRGGLIKMILSRFTIPLIPTGIRYSGNRGRTLVQINIGHHVYGDSLIAVDEFLDHIMKEIGRLSGF